MTFFSFLMITSSLRFFGTLDCFGTLDREIQVFRFSKLGDCEIDFTLCSLRNLHFCSDLLERVSNGTYVWLDTESATRSSPASTPYGL